MSEISFARNNFSEKMTGELDIMREIRSLKSIMSGRWALSIRNIFLSPNYVQQYLLKMEFNSVANLYRFRFHVSWCDWCYSRTSITPSSLSYYTLLPILNGFHDTLCDIVCNPGMWPSFMQRELNENVDQCGRHLKCIGLYLYLWLRFNYLKFKDVDEWNRYQYPLILWWHWTKLQPC